MEDCSCGKVRQCKICQKRYNHEWYKANRTEQHKRVKANTQRYRTENNAYVRALKAGPCTDCKNCFHWFAMDFDHVRGEKLRDVSLMMKSFPLEKLKEEIAKCDLLCATCHRLRTARRLNLPL